MAAADLAAEALEAAEALVVEAGEVEAGEVEVEVAVAVAEGHCWATMIPAAAVVLRPAAPAVPLRTRHRLPMRWHVRRDLVM